VVKFVVNEDGHISEVQVVRGIGGGCDEEAKRVVQAMPAWKPGKQNGKAVKVYFTLPIQFKLE
jgi:protein TonB